MGSKSYFFITIPTSIIQFYLSFKAISRSLDFVFPHLYHCPCVELAVIEERLTGVISILWRHIGYLGIDGHRLTAIVYGAIEVFVVQFWIVGLQSGQHVLNTERAVHLWHIDHLLAERLYQVDDMIGNIRQMFAQVGIGLSQFMQSATLKAFVIGSVLTPYRRITVS